MSSVLRARQSDSICRRRICRQPGAQSALDVRRATNDTQCVLYRKGSGGQPSNEAPVGARPGLRLSPLGRRDAKVVTLMEPLAPECSLAWVRRDVSKQENWHDCCGR